MRKLAILAWTLTAACTLPACGAQAGHPTTSAAAPSSSTAPAFTDVNNLVVALKAKITTQKSVHSTISGSAAEQSLSGSADMRWDASGVAVNMTLNMGGWQIQVITLARAMYIKMPLGSQADPNKPWVKITADGDDRLSQLLDETVKSMQQGTDIDPVLDDMKAAGTLTRSTQETLGTGADVTHYWITLDVAKLAQSRTNNAALQRAIDSKTAINEEISVSKDNLPVKFTVQLPGSNGTTSNIVAHYSGWGQPVDITAPPADQIGQLPKLGG